MTLKNLLLISLFVLSLFSCAPTQYQTEIPDNDIPIISNHENNDAIAPIITDNKNNSNIGENTRTPIITDKSNESNIDEYAMAIANYNNYYNDARIISNHRKNYETVVKDLLLKEFEEWKGTPHKLGGYSRKGIDCSGFAHYIYNKIFNIDVPRTTRYFFTAGIEINRSQLKLGDLVAFRPDSYPRHVGIYIGDNKFIHTSAKKGVAISDLGNPYWKKYYTMSRRLIKNIK